MHKEMQNMWESCWPWFKGVEHTIDFAGGELSDWDRITNMEVNTSIVIAKDAPCLQETLRSQTRADTLNETPYLQRGSLHSLDWHMAASQAKDNYTNTKESLGFSCVKSVSNFTFLPSA